MKLHEAIEHVLKQQNRGMSPRELANIINERELYSRNDGGLIPASQISARINNYQHLFKKSDDGLIYRINDFKKDILSLAFEMQSRTRNFYAHSGVLNNQIEAIIPFIFFYKRILDRKVLFEILLITDTNAKFDLNGLYNFANDLNSNSKWFSNKLESLIRLLEDILKDASLFNFDNEIKKLSIYDFSKLSDHEFGGIFSEILANSPIRNIRHSQLSIPNELSELIGRIIKRNVFSDAVLYNPGTGQASIPTFVSRNTTNDFQFWGEEINQSDFVLSLMNLICNGVIIKEYSCNDSLSQNNSDFADIVVSDPPYMGRINSVEIESKYPVRTQEIVLLFIQRAVKALKNGGVAAIIVPESVLFNNSKQFKELRKYLIVNHLVESVISLPAGVLQPMTGIKISLLVLSKKENREILLIDADSKEFFQKDGYKIKLNVPKIENIYFEKFEDNIVNEPESQYGRKIFERISVDLLHESDFDLNVKGYLLESNDDNNLQPISEIIEPYKSVSHADLDEIPYVNITDLNNDFKELFLNENNLQKNQRNQSGIYLDRPALLIGSIPPRMKPSYFKAEKSPVIVSQNIHVFLIKEKKVKDINIEYLLFELSSQRVAEQFEAYATGSTSLRRISRNDFLKIKIRFPDNIKEQDSIVATQKEALYAAKLIEAESFADKMGITRIEEKKLLGFIKHEIGNITPGISTDVSNLQQFFSKRIDLNEKISGSKNAASLLGVFSRIQSNINDVENLLENIANIIRVGDESISKKNVKFKKYIRKEVEKQYSLLKNNKINVLIGIDQEYTQKQDRDIFIDTNQFSYLVRNFLINTVKHAFDNLTEERSIIINMNEDKDFYYLSLINNGKPFPDGFSLDDFLSFGGRVENQKGSGLGGFLIGKVVENHKGTIDLLESGTVMFLEDTNTESGFISNNFIRVGIHFFIKLPKIQ